MEGRNRMALLAAFATAATACAAQPETPLASVPPTVLLVATPSGAAVVQLKLVVLCSAGSAATEGTLQVAFAAAAAAEPIEVPPPGPRGMTLPWRPPAGASDQVQIVGLGEVSLAPPCPEVLEVRGGVRGQPLRPLGWLRRGAAGAASTFTRAYPAAGGKTGLLFVAVYEPSEERLFNLRLACFNCGDHREADQDLFLHFEPAPTGTDLQATMALGLPPDARPTDSGSWSPGDQVVASFGPYSIPEHAPEFIYLRAGLYYRQGDGARAPVEGPDDTRRALLGRLVTRAGQTWFERAPLPGSEVPAGWGAATAGGRP